MIRHHPSDETLLACAAATLPEAHALVVAAHAALCPACARTLRHAEAAGGAILSDLPPTALAADALERAFAHLDAPVAPASWDRAPLPPTLAALATGRWRWTGPGIAMMSLLPRDASDTRLDLIRVAPGVALLEHGHAGRESTCVLQGGFADEDGEYHEGDFVAGGDGAHRPVALAGEPCICLIATSGHLRPRGPLGWLVRPLLGM